MTSKIHWQRWLVYGKPRVIGKPLYAFIIAAELAAERGLDALHPRRRPNDRSLVAENLTAIVKTFERPKVVKRLIASIKRQYPELKIIVVDDSRQPIEIDGVQMVALPFDSGVSAGRNEGLRHVSTRYVLNLDDDFVFYRHTDLDTALSLIEQHVQIDIMGGEQLDLPLFEKFNYRQAALHPTRALATHPPGSTIGGLPVYDKVPSFFIARTDRIRLVGWDPNIKRLDHADFFTRAKGVLTTVFNAKMKCLHARTPFDTTYMQSRYDVEMDQAVLKMKYYKDRASE
jgi:glycosyltransferase involved in cell wall biosynthesis